MSIKGVPTSECLQENCPVPSNVLVKDLARWYCKSRAGRLAPVRKSQEDTDRGNGTTKAGSTTIEILNPLFRSTALIAKIVNLSVRCRFPSAQEEARLMQEYFRQKALVKGYQGKHHSP